MTAFALPDRDPTPLPPVYAVPDSMVKLGELKGRTWFTYPGQEGEYELLNDRPLRDKDPFTRLEDGQLYVMGEITGEGLHGNPVTERVWRPTKRHPAGTFARGGKPPAAPVTVRGMKPLRKVDALTFIPVFAEKRSTMFTIGDDRKEAGLGRPDPIVEKRGEARARGWRQAAERLNRRGLTLIPTPDGRVTLASAGGRCPPELLAIFAEVADWIAAGMAGKPWPCAWCKTEADTLLAGGVPACEEHAAA